MERFIDVVDIASGQRTTVVSTHGVNLDPMFSPDGNSLLFQRTDVENSLDLYVAPVHENAQITRLSDPTLWRCGIDVAGVVDWATYGAGPPRRG
jgi:Tol biopolymer transport system component